MADREIRYRATLDARGFKRGSREVARESDSLGRKTDRLIGRFGDLANATGITGREILSFAADTIRLGAAAEVTAESFKRTFGPATEELEARISDLALSVGVTTSEMRAMLTPTGQLLQSFGLTASESADFAATMFESAAALAAFAPSIGDASDAMDSLGGALRGEFDSLEKWGVGIKQADVNLRALEMTGKDSVDQLTKQELAMAALDLITEQTADETAALEENTDSAAAKLAEMEARARELQEELGLALLPILTENTDELIELAEAVGDLMPLMAGLAGLIADAAGEFLEAIGPILTVKTLLEDFDTGSVRHWTTLVAGYFDLLLSPIRSVYNAAIDLINLFGAGLPSIPSISSTLPPVPSTGSVGSGPGTSTPPPGGGSTTRPGAFAGGGRVPGPLGKPMLATVHGGEMISGIGGRSGGGGGGPTIVIEAGISDPLAIARAVVDALQLYEQNIGPVPIGLGEIV